jgi:alanyl-tRNA synthetase
MSGFFQKGIEMKNKSFIANEIRQNFIDFFINKANHTFVRSSPLVPGDDSTLLFTNAGMVQFKDIFLGIEKPPYTRAVNFQKCLRVAGKHNDLEDVGQDDTHHTFFEMLGNWSFGDYYKKEAITWAWELLTVVWKIPKDRLYVTVLKDELGEIPTDEEAAMYWRQQPGFNPDHIFYLGRKDNLWEMADTGPCGPCSEIHIDLRPEDGEVFEDTIETDRFTELWNLVFIQYNRIAPDQLKPLPTTHIDTGMGFERIVSILQGSGSNYRTDLFWPLIQETARLTGHTEDEINFYFTPYRVIADHARAATFLIADGVVPGNIGRNYICRMIIRRAYRFGAKIGMDKPFLAAIAKKVVEYYGDAYPELVLNRTTILDTITREEIQFQNTLEKATSNLDALLDKMIIEGENTITGEQAANLYTTYGMPLEITRDIAQERGLFVDEDGFNSSMEAHRLASGAGKAMGEIGGEDVELYQKILIDLQSKGVIGEKGVQYDPYGSLESLKFSGEILAMVKDAQRINTAEPGDIIEIILPKTKFYADSGGQVADHGIISGEKWDFVVSDIRTPAAGMITHVGKVTTGFPKVGDQVLASIDTSRRKDTMRNHTSTHLLHAALQKVLGVHARQAGSLVAPDRLRFDFTHPEALNQDEIRKIEDYVNNKILENYPLNITHKSLDDALKGGAIALFGEKYGDKVRNITIGEKHIFSNELCGGTHVENTGEIGTFIITNESSVAAGIRRIEAITGRRAYNFIQDRFRILDEVAASLSASPDQIVEKSRNALLEIKELGNQVRQLKQEIAVGEFYDLLKDVHTVKGVNILTAEFIDSDAETLRKISDRFRLKYPENGVAVFASVIDKRPIIIAAVTKDLVDLGIKAGDLAGHVARQLGGGGGGKPTLAQAGGKDPTKLKEALDSVRDWVSDRIS